MNNVISLCRTGSLHGIDRVYYGNAIRNSTSDLEKMRVVVRATYFHKLSTDNNPQHGLCPQDSCKYNTADRDKYSHHGLPEEIMSDKKKRFTGYIFDRQHVNI
jgi:hypothetical protein